ncbi:hypothetical protein BKM20_13010 [Pseudomonas avellanae]|uniref:Uncharacterized protein n=1 Tax=Pseudomonas avellanae pv. morsprunorum TaxID=3380385 RepID=A0ABX4YXR9_9PSED|nr:hypothetical protein AL055_05060 [Pseudomonas amygdali pv. morsprunorum]PHN48949.1 hypothetical protein AO261_22600 [Pseudomonas avellanae]POC92954.1 hypothetical protein BKM26_13135 [Pseudomonas avellanae]POD08378.1 hypothetical protein BKM20_13010 [Pseudomonas avellanae]POD25422.1 hypothetical protein BKM05_12215 [Pseudomonas avellanae]
MVAVSAETTQMFLPRKIEGHIFGVLNILKAIGWYTIFMLEIQALTHLILIKGKSDTSVIKD